ncbi:5214_t:CDS:2 [Entrophospora sp. SA101]|nr:5214_t:CDS:2 [Entrophospora sp. SA101]
MAVTKKPQIEEKQGEEHHQRKRNSVDAVRIKLLIANHNSTEIQKKIIRNTGDFKLASCPPSDYTCLCDALQQIQLCFQQCRDDLDIQNEGKTYESVVRQFCELTASASSTTTSSPQPPPVTPTVNQSLATTFFAPTGNSTSSSSGSSVPTTTTTTKTTSNANKLSLSNCDVFSFLVSWLHCDDLNIKKKSINNRGNNAISS